MTIATDEERGDAVPRAEDEIRPEAPPRDDLVRAILPAPEFRDEPKDGTLGRLRGYFAVFNEWANVESVFEGTFRERVAPGAFAKTIKESLSSRRSGPPLQALFDHGQDLNIGRKPMGPIVDIGEDQKGGYYEVDVLDTSYNRDLIPGLRAGVYGSSFRFDVIKDDMNHWAKRSADNPTGMPERTLQEIRLKDVGPTPFPVYPQATAGMRSMTDEFMVRKLQEQPERTARLIESVTRSHSAGEQPDEEATAADPALPTDGAAPGHSDEGSRSEPEEAQAAATEQAADEAPADEERSSTPPPAVAEPPPENKEVEVKTVEERRSRVDEIKARLAEINNEAGVNELRSERQVEWDDLLKEKTAHESAITSWEQRSVQLQEDSQRSEKRVEVGGAPQIFTNNRSRVPSNIYELDEYRSLSRTEGEYRQALADGGMKAIEHQVFPHPRADQNKVRSHIERLIEKFKDEKEGNRFAAHLIATGNPIYARSYWRALSGKYLTGEEQRALATVGSTQLADGGYAVPYQLDPSIILTSDGSTNPLRTISRVEQVTGNTWKGVTSAGVTVSRGAEEAAITPTSPTLAQPSVTVQAVKAEIQFSIESDEDWPQLQAEMAVVLQDAKDAEEANAFVNGTGLTVNPEGVVYGLDATSDVGTTGDGFDLGDIDRLVSRLPDRFEPRARFLAHRALYAEIDRLARAAGVNEPPLASGSAPTLKGYPKHNSSAMEDDFTTSANEVLLFGDFNYFIIVDKIGLGLEIDPHVRDGDGKWTGQRALLAHYRNSSQILADNAFRLLKIGVVTS